MFTLVVSASLLQETDIVFNNTNAGRIKVIFFHICDSFTRQKYIKMNIKAMLYNKKKHEKWNYYSY